MTIPKYTISSVAEVNPRKWRTEPREDELVSFVPMASVEVATGRLDPSDLRPWTEVKRGYRRFEEGDVLVAKITPSMENGKAALAKGLKGGRGAGSTEFHVLRPGPELDPSYLLHFMLQTSTRREARAHMKGVAGQLRVPPEFFSEYMIPLPPLDEQRETVEAIETQFARLDDAVAALERARIRLRRYRASVLKSACEGTLVPTEADLARQEGREYEPASVLLDRIRAEREAAPVRRRGRKTPAPVDTSTLPKLPEGWAWTTIGDCFDVYVGATPSRKEPTYWDGDIPWVSSGEVAFCTIYSTRETITEVGLSKTSTTLHPPGTVLIGMIGEGRTRGQVAMLGLEACNNQNSAAIRVSETPIDSWYVYRYLESQYEETRRQGSGNNQPALNKSRVQKIQFPVPPLAEQERIVEEVERRLSVIEQMEATVETNLKRAESLRQSILRQAFSGQLV